MSNWDEAQLLLRTLYVFPQEADFDEEDFTDEEDYHKRWLEQQGIKHSV